MNNSNIMEHLKLFTNMMQEVVRSTPSSWKEGVLVVRRNGEDVECEITNQNTSEHLEICENIFSLCGEFARFQTSPDWQNNWLEATLPCTLGEEPGDFSCLDGTYKYPDRGN